MLDQTKSLALWDEMDRTLRVYPKGVVPVPKPIRGTAFFPGGLGLLLDGACPLDDVRVMVVGQDFNTEATYAKAQEHGSEIGTSRTWKNIETVFPKLGLDRHKCFFTNFYMGLREHGPETGTFPGARDSDFVRACARFFERQMEVIEPQLIVTLGLAPLKAIGREVFGLQTPSRLSECVDVYLDLKARHGDVALVPITHPSLYFSNIGRRRFQGYKGMDAEKEMIRQAQSHVCK